MALTATTQHGPRLTAISPKGLSAGLSVGMPLADARALTPGLQVADADLDGDIEALSRLTLWCTRYSPVAEVQGLDGIAIDLTGVAHLFGGEGRLVEDLAGKLEGFGLTASLVVAPTIGAAWALARYGDRPLNRIGVNRLGAWLAPLPVAALRLPLATVEGLGRLGLKRIGDLVGKPRAPLTARFGPELMIRLDQALGRHAEALVPLRPVPHFRRVARFAEPIMAQGDIEAVLTRLAHALANRLETAGTAGRSFVFTLFRVDGKSTSLDIRTARPTRDAAHILRLFRDRLASMAEEVDAGFGFDIMALGAFDTEGQDATQPGLSPEPGIADPQDLAILIDRLVTRFGGDRVTRFVPRESYLPERAAAGISAIEAGHIGKAGKGAALAPGSPWAEHLAMSQGGHHQGRPLLILTTPSPIETLAELPDGPPARFTWQRVAHKVTRAEGPERIEPEWWSVPDGQAPPPRDYYRVEDDQGRRYWLFREGLYDGGTPPRWYMHGVLP
ncbi:Y-family DNA polymerase [Cucumibacter marinus]|uniref:Y-family DNA polymerase n=1 Tax=Cucumibacter marinus TaxID=1121252 RepID=UPI001FE13DCE|nr:DNA polymerase Y family protein [Cucumibacter marinus]